jgi:hypothetical protein
MRFFRLLKIIFVVLRFGLDEFLLAHEHVRWMRVPLNILLFLRKTDKSVGWISAAHPPEHLRKVDALSLIHPTL